MSPTMSAPATILFAPDRAPFPDSIVRWLEAQPSPRILVTSGDELMAITLRGRPRMVVFDARTAPVESFAACGRLKGDSYTGIVPAFMVATDGDVIAAFEAGAD